MQVDPINPTLKAPGTKRLKLNCDTLLSTSAFNFNLRLYAEVTLNYIAAEVGPGLPHIAYHVIESHLD